MKAKVLVILPTDKFLHRKILEGILDYGRQHGPWQFHFETGDRYEQGLTNGSRWGCNGIISMPREHAQLATILQSGIPSVVLNPPSPLGGRQTALPPKNVTYVNRNQEDVGRTAANYFLERGYRHFAFVGIPEPTGWCLRRQEGFVSTLARKGHRCDIFGGAPKDARASFDLEAPHLSSWLKNLSPGTALYAVRDRRALQILGLCLENGITVPDTIAVLGTDNDEVLCDTATPSLSSISLDGHNAGLLCAKLLAQHMRYKHVEPFVDLAFPTVVTRLSTDANLIEDPFIAKALTLVRKNLSRLPSLPELAAQLGVSERTLELKAKLVLGTTLKAEVDRIRLNEAVRLVSNSDLPLREIAEMCGYCCTSHMGTAFRTTFGHSPSVFRYQEPK